MTRSRKPHSKKGKSKSSSLPWVQICIVLSLSVGSLIVWSFYSNFQAEKTANIRAVISGDIQRSRELWAQGNNKEAAKIGKLLERFPEYLNAGDRNNIGICLWDDKQYLPAMKQFVLSYKEEPAFGTINNLIGAWVEGKKYVLSEPELRYFLGEIIFNEAMKPDTEWSPFFRSSAGRCLFAHGLSHLSVELYSHLLSHGIYESEEAKTDIYHNLGLAEMFQGNWQDGTPKLIEASHKKINQWDTRFLNGSVQPPYEIHNIFEGLIDSPKVQYEEIALNLSLYYGIHTHTDPPSAQLALPEQRKFKERSTYVVKYSNIQFENYGLLHNDENEFFLLDAGLFSIFKGDYPFPMQQIHFKEAVYLSGWSKNYYHWTIESLSRVVLLQQQNFFQNHPDAVLLLTSNSSFVHQSLNAVGFPENKRIFLVQGTHQVFVDELYGITSLPWEEFTFSCLHHQIPPRISIRLMNQYFNPNPLSLAERKKIIYVMREASWVTRATMHDELFIPAMQKLYGDLFIIHNSSLPFIEQVALYKDVRLIIGPHGAGLSNIVFATPRSTAVIELPTEEKHLQFYFSHISAALDMFYWTVPSVSSSYYGYYPNTKQSTDTLLQVVSDTMKFLHRLENSETPNVLY